MIIKNPSKDEKIKKINQVNIKNKNTSETNREKTYEK